MQNQDGLTNKLFWNAGTFRKTGSTGTSSLYWPLNTTGTMDIQTGTLYVASWTGNSTLHGTASLSGTLGSANTTVTVAGDTVLNLSGDPNGTVTVASNALMTWTGGTLNGSLTV